MKKPLYSEAFFLLVLPCFTAILIYPPLFWSPKGLLAFLLPLYLCLKGRYVTAPPHKETKKKLTFWQKSALAFSFPVDLSIFAAPAVVYEYSSQQKELLPLLTLWLVLSVSLKNIYFISPCALFHNYQEMEPAQNFLEKSKILFFNVSNMALFSFWYINTNSITLGAFMLFLIVNFIYTQKRGHTLLHGLFGLRPA